MFYSKHFVTQKKNFSSRFLCQKFSPKFFYDKNVIRNFFAPKYFYTKMSFMPNFSYLFFFNLVFVVLYFGLCLFTSLMDKFDHMHTRYILALETR